LNYDFILENGVKCASNLMTKSIKETKKSLETKLMGIEESGPTALGPGIFSAIALAGEGAPGSLVIVCTDGLANVGLGNFDESHSDLESQKVDEYYERISQYAKSKGVVVSIVSIKGDECNIDTLSKVAETTGGEV
jgi:hypothetical protein